MPRKAGAAHVRSKAGDAIPPSDRDQFVEVAETELLGLHEGNFARYHIRPQEFAVWQAAWDQRP
jgi:hypothetical protein